ncbi:MAG: 3-phosphoglycerate dehydrogenase, partial [Lentisphaeria bacterium]|nr:3-phosphoglycerate dehydrogenase [Lentisphaeria bacterium]
MKPRVLLTSYYNREIIDSSLEPLRQVATLVDGNRNRNWTLDEMLAEIPGIHATVAADEPYTREVFERADELLVVARDGTGFDKIDVQAATDHGIIVTRAPVVIDATANLTIGLMI